MSIFVVRLKEWFPLGDDHHDTAKYIATGARCEACYKKVRWRAALGYHALPWGYSAEVWCSWKCVTSGKKAKPDKRQLRKMKKRFPKEYWSIV